MTQPFHVSPETEYRGGLSVHSPQCIAYNLPKEKVQSVLENISNKAPVATHEASVYSASVDWTDSLSKSISQELSTSFNAQPENFVKTGRDVARIVSSIGKGIWSSGITPINAVKDIETNFPLYISDYFDQLSGWSREHVFDQNDTRIGSNLTEIQPSNKPYPAESPYGLEAPLSQVFVKLGWSIPVANINRSFNTDSNTPTFSSGTASDGSVYRYYAFVDSYKQAVSVDEHGSIVKITYNFTDSSQIWRLENYGKYYGLYNKKYKQYLGRDLKLNPSKPDNNWHKSALYIVEDPNTSVYSIGYTDNNRDYHPILNNLNLITIPLISWRNSSGNFLSSDLNGNLNFSQGEKHGNTVIPTSEQLFLFVPHPDFSRKAVVVGHNGKFLEVNPLSGKASCNYDLKSSVKLPFSLFDYNQNVWPRSAHYLASRLQQSLILSAAAAAAPPPGQGTRVRMWKADPSVRKIGIRELFLVHTDITTGPVDDLLQTESTADPIAPDNNGDFLLDFDDTPSTVPESDNHTRFDVIHTYSCVRYTYDVLSGDLEYLDGSPPALDRPWGNNKRLTVHPHAGEDANAYYSRQEAALKFFYTTQNGKLIYLCRSIDVVAHEAGHSFLDILQPGWYGSGGQTGGFHEAFGDLCSLFILLSMAEVADLFITLTKANLRDPDNFISAVGEEFGDALYNNKGKGLRNLSNDIKGSKAGTEVHALSQVFSGYYYDVLVDVFALERNPAIKSDTETLMDVGAILRRALIIAIRVSSGRSTRTKYQEIATNLEAALGTLGRRLGADLSSWIAIVRKYAISRELSIAGLPR